MDDLLTQIEAFLERHDMEISTFGVQAINDGGLIPDLKDGRSLRKRTRRKILDFMANYKVPKKSRAS